MIKFTTRGIAIILGVVFLVSGWLKGLDPFGASLKVNEYVSLFQLHFLENMGMVLAVLLCALELVVGLLLLFGIYQRLIACVAFVIMLGFTAITGKWNLKHRSFIDIKADNIEELISSEKNVTLRYWIAIALGLLIGVLLVFKCERKKCISNEHANNI